MFGLLIILFTYHLSIKMMEDCVGSESVVVVQVKKKKLQSFKW